MRKTRNIAIAFSVVVIILLGLHAEVITVPVMAQEPDARIGFRKVAEEGIGPVRRAVVNNQQFLYGSLPENFLRNFHHCGGLVEDRHHNRQARVDR